MKKIILLLLITATFSGCKKGGKDYSAVQNNLVGKWELRKSEGGIAGTIIYQPGNGNIFEFKTDSFFFYYGSSNIVRAGTYNLQPVSGKDEYKLTFNTNVKESQNITLKGDTLVLLSSAPYVDMPDLTYVKINQ